MAKKPTVKINQSALKKAAQKAVKSMSGDLTRSLNGLIPTYQGRPLDEVKTAVQRAWSRNSGGGSITDPELTKFAEEIVAGRRVEVRAKS